jgi:hypothetical protein
MKITRVYSNKPRIAFPMIQNEGQRAHLEGACFHPHKNAMRLEAASLNWHHMETAPRGSVAAVLRHGVLP